jgi:acyl-CoA synthetase (AMP-forming)/AMP-acid ligase II
MRKSVQDETNVVYPTVVSLLRMRAEHQPRRVAYTFAPDCGGEQEITYSELDRWASAIACRLDEMDIRGKPAMLLYPPGIGFIAAFFGCLYAGAVAVPGCPPDPLRIDRSLPRLVAVARDAAPSVVLTTATMSTMLGSLSEALPELSGLRVMTTCDVATDRSGSWEPGPVEAESVALLQYTSGSTSAPKGVVLTHRNLMSNSELIFRFFGHSEESRGVSWLPVYHDMGLIGGILQPLYGGFPVTLMAPADFARQPLSWLQEISRTRATTSGGPNFAYDLCVRKTTAAQRAGLDLSSWRVAFNGSEPIRAETMENFARAFEPAGFSREAFHPCYGLAEATLIVTGGLPWSRRGVTSFDAARLRDGTAVSSAADTSSRRLVSCGFASRDRDLVIADPDTRVERAAGQVGEIWISGRGAAPSYWRRPAETRETFGAYLAGTSEGPFLRSGDLGFVLGRQLFVTGRIKDLIIIRGRNHYPQDIEWTAERSSPVLRRGGAAAFSVPHEDQERLVVAQEITRQAGDVSISEVAGAIRAAVAAAHEVQVHTVVLLPPGEIPKTSSGKVQRSLCAAMFAGGQLAELGRSEISSAAETGQLHLDRSSLLSVAPGERRGLLEDYLCRLVASACGIDAAKVADSPLLALGIDSYAVISIQHVIQTDLSVRITSVDLAHATSVADLAVRLDEQLMATAAAARADVSAVARRPEPAVTDKASARLYCWVRGSRVSADAAPDADLFPDPGGRQAGEQPCWASLSAEADRQHRRESRRPGPWLRSQPGQETRRSWPI